MSEYVANAHLAHIERTVRPRLEAATAGTAGAAVANDPYLAIEEVVHRGDGFEWYRCAGALEIRPRAASVTMRHGTRLVLDTDVDTFVLAARAGLIRAREWRDYDTRLPATWFMLHGNIDQWSRARQYATPTLAKEEEEEVTVVHVAQQEEKVEVEDSQ